jgi:hypothetical protein
MDLDYLEVAAERDALQAECDRLREALEQIAHMEWIENGWAAKAAREALASLTCPTSSEEES